VSVLKKLWQAVETLATSLTGLAVTLDTLNEQVRQRGGLDMAAEPPLLVENNGQPEPTALPAGRKRKI
jgi:hypothetical protein